MEKTDLEIFVIVIPKEGLAAGGNDYHTITRNVGYNAAVGVIQKEGLAGPAHQSFFWYDNDKDLKVCLPMMPFSFPSPMGASLFVSLHSILISLHLSLIAHVSMFCIQIKCNLKGNDG